MPCSVLVEALVGGIRDGFNELLIAMSTADILGWASTPPMPSKVWYKVALHAAAGRKGSMFCIRCGVQSDTAARVCAICGRPQPGDSGCAPPPPSPVASIGRITGQTPSGKKGNVRTERKTTGKQLVFLICIVILVAAALTFGGCDASHHEPLLDIRIGQRYCTSGDYVFATSLESYMAQQEALRSRDEIGFNRVVTGFPRIAKGTQVLVLDLVNWVGTYKVRVMSGPHYSEVLYTGSEWLCACRASGPPGP
jgi:hypothetical protein